MSVNLSIRASYNFTLWPSAVLNSNYKNVRVLGIMDADSARREIDIDALHAQVYPYLPPGSPNNASAYDYVRIKTISGDTTIIGIAWIKEDTLVLVDNITIDIVINNVLTSDVERIRAALIQNGITTFALKVRDHNPT